MTGTPASPTQPQPTGGPIRIPPLTPEKANEYATFFDRAGAENGLLGGDAARRIFEQAQLSHETLGRIWNLSDTQDRGALDVTEFIIAMHLLMSCRSRVMQRVPNTLPPGLYEAAARRGARTSLGSRPGSAIPPPIAQQLTGQGRPQSPAAPQFTGPMSAQSTGDGWLVSPTDKVRFDQAYSTVDTAGLGYITGDQAVPFFQQFPVSQDALATIWDLSDINGNGQLTKDEFAVAMFLIGQQLHRKAPLPTTLPPALVPPSMRRGNVQPTPSTAPTFNQQVHVPQQQKSAADDLLGLDDFAAPASPPRPQVPQSTGSSAAPFQAPTSPISATHTASSTFKPFMPSSSFGQSILPQKTGSPAPQSQARSPPPATEDLMGDTDPEVSSKLTQETTELANLSNQVGNLSNQMQEVQRNRSVTDQQLSQSSQQKREFETRLSQLRTLYEQEVKNVKVVEDQLTQTRNETRRVQQEFAMLDGTYQDLKTQHQQLSSQYETEQRESVSLKEKLRQMNAEIATLKPAVEKLKSDARQQKGLNAINRKQLATVEGEHDKLQADQVAATKELEEAKIEAQSAANTPVAVTSPPAVASPAASVRSQNNPFFRRQPSGLSESATVSPAAQRAPETNNAFDSFFGSFGAPVAQGPPPTSFRSDSPAVDAPVREGSPFVESAPRGLEPPAPPGPGQFTPSALPLDPARIERSDSPSSSVRAAPPASRLGAGETPRVATPLAPESHSQAGSSPVEIQRSDIEGGQSNYFDQAPTTAAPAESAAPLRPEITGGTTGTSSDRDIPGAFPSFTPAAEIPPAAEAFKGKEVDKGDNFDDFFSAVPQSSQNASGSNDPFFIPPKQHPEANGTPVTATKEEFPPIQYMNEEDDDDDSDSELGFEDNFTAPTQSGPSAPAPAHSGDATIEKPETLQPSAAQRPAATSLPSNNSTLPAIDSQSSPPSYDKSVEQGADHFPAEYEGLVPHREDPMSEPPHSVNSATGAPVERKASQDYGPESAKSPPQSIKSPTGPEASGKPINNEFDFMFQNLGTAKEEDSSDDDDLAIPGGHGNSTEWNPDFSDSPVASKTGGAPHSQFSFDNFEGTPTSSANPGPPTASGSGTQGNSTSNLDFDDLFKGFGTANNQTTSPTSAFPAVSQQGESSTAPTESLAPSKPSVPERPSPGRALSTTTEHDDPIVKQTMELGFPRDATVAALEKFDYNREKVSLTSSTFVHLQKDIC